MQTGFTCAAANWVAAICRVAATCTAVVALLGCAPRTLVYSVEDPTGDVRLAHPEAPSISRGTFDLIRLNVFQTPRNVVVEATFAAPIQPVEIGMVDPHANRRRTRYAQTVDVYLDLQPGGEVEALRGRGFTVPAFEAWDTVLVVSTFERSVHPKAVIASHVSHYGRTLRAVFPKDALAGPPRGVLVAVLATSVSGEGGVRSVGTLPGECQTWDEVRCTLVGTGPAVLDATQSVEGGVISLAYAEAARPKAVHVPVVFSRGPLVTAAPIPLGVVEGSPATVYGAAGQPLGVAVVQMVTGDTATLRVVGEDLTGPASVSFGSLGVKEGEP